jgi:hypothetical protein
MERLTDKNKLWGAILKEDILVLRGSDAVNEAVRRLAAYEDTDLTPEQVDAFRADNERMGKELAAAVEDIAAASERSCEVCKYAKIDMEAGPCQECLDFTDKKGKHTYPHWQWRGLAGREGTE